MAMRRLVTAAALAAAAALPLALSGPAAAVTTPPPRPGTVPGVAVWAGGAVAAGFDVLWTAADGRVHLRHAAAEVGDPIQVDLGGVATSGPGGIGRTPPGGPSGEAAYVRGTDGAVWVRRYTEDTGWQPWRGLGGRSTGAPSATCVGAGDAPDRVYVRGTDGALWRRIGDGPWRSLGGVLGSDPAAATGAAFTCLAREDVVALGPDGGVRELVGGTWRSLGGRSTVAPALVVTPGRSDVFVRGLDDALWTATRPDGGAWSGWRRIGGILSGPPAANAWPREPVRTLAVVAAGADGDLWLALEDPAARAWTWRRWA